MTENREQAPIICIGFTGWSGNFAKSTLQIMGRLARKRLVVYVDYPFTIKDLIDALLGKRDIEWKRIVGFKQRLREEAYQSESIIYVLSLPPVIPVNWLNSYKLFKMGLRLNSWFIQKTINRSIRQLKITDPLVINAYNPFYGLFNAGKFKEQKLVYYCYDEISGSPWAQKYGAMIEKEYLKKVDLIITSSKALHQSKEKLHANCQVVENGVDFSMFNSYYNENERPQQTETTIGYIGSLDERIDYQLLRYIALQRPQYQYHFVGRVVFPELLEPIRNIPNITLIEAVEYHKLPELLLSFDITIIPFLKTKFTKNIYPLKINEYLAMGKPVVRTDFACLPEFDKLVEVGKTHHEFLEKLDYLVQSDPAELKQKRIDLSKQNSWENRVQQFTALISG